MYRAVTLLVIVFFDKNLDMLYIMLTTFVIANFKVLTQKMIDLSKKNCFCNVYVVYAFITQLLKLKNGPKFSVMFLNYLSKDPESFIKLFRKSMKICFLRKPHINQNSFAMSTFEHLLLRMYNSKMLTNLGRRSSIIIQKILKILSSYLKNQRRYAFFCKPPKHYKTRILLFTFHMIKRQCCTVTLCSVS